VHDELPATGLAAMILFASVDMAIFRLSRNSRENRTSFEGQPNISNALARRESEL
jgi:hypothetical protein